MVEIPPGIPPNNRGLTLTSRVDHIGTLPLLVIASDAAEGSCGGGSATDQRRKRARTVAAMPPSPHRNSWRTIPCWTLLEYKHAPRGDFQCGSMTLQCH